MENTISQFYTQNASVYDPAMERSFISRLIRSHFQACLATSFCGVDQVLDVGCGTGTDALFLAEKGVKVYDLKKEMNLLKYIKRLRFKFMTAQYMRVSYLSPRRVVMVTTRVDEKDNVLPIDWHMPISFEPKLYAICLETHNHSASMIRQSGTFVVNFVDAALEEKILLCGHASGRSVDKFTLSGLGRRDASTVDVSVLTEAIGHLECRVIDEKIWGDHTVFVGKVLKTDMEEGKTKELYHVTKFQ